MYISNESDSRGTWSARVVTIRDPHLARPDCNPILVHSSSITNTNRSLSLSLYVFQRKYFSVPFDWRYIHIFYVKKGFIVLHFRIFVASRIKIRQLETDWTIMDVCLLCVFICLSSLTVSKGEVRGVARARKYRETGSLELDSAGRWKDRWRIAPGTKLNICTHYVLRIFTNRFYITCW
jgi:hypothetical protein